MKIGDRVFVSGYIDEIRKDTVIVRNDGGYFGTVLSEVTGELPSAQPEIIRCVDCKYNNDCDIQFHAQAGDTFYCGAAERKTDGSD